MSAIRMFELASRASLNIEKSIIIPLTYPLPQEWCQRTSCRIFLPHEIVKYLGCLIGFKVIVLQEVKFLMGKVRKCLFHLANKSLSFARRIFLLRHVVRAMPIYHFMSMSLNPKSYLQNFLVG